MSKQNNTLLCDFYELTMANGYFELGKRDEIAYFDVFFRKIPDGGGFAIAAGLEQLIDYTAEMIAPYVERDPTKFCTYEQFLKGVDTIQEYCLLRAESVRGQLDGSIPSTSAGQSADSSALVNASHVTVSDMGTMGMGGGFGGKRN